MLHLCSQLGLYPFTNSQGSSIEMQRTKRLLCHIQSSIKSNNSTSTHQQPYNHLSTPFDPSPLLVFPLSRLAALLAVAASLGLAQLVDRLLEELKVLGGTAARCRLAGLGVVVILDDLGFLGLVLQSIFSAFGRKAAEGQVVRPDGETDDGGVFESWLGKFVGLSKGLVLGRVNDG